MHVAERFVALTPEIGGVALADGDALAVAHEDSLVVNVIAEFCQDERHWSVLR